MNNAELSDKDAFYTGLMIMRKVLGILFRNTDRESFKRVWRRHPKKDNVTFHYITVLISKCKNGNEKIGSNYHQFYKR